jgi:hypothetical protein
VSAFDVWATEFTLGLDPWDTQLRTFAERPVCQRLLDLLSRLSAPPSQNASALRACVDARDEIVHYLPRILPDERLPSWIAELDAQGLLIKHPREGIEFTLAQKFASYALAHWAFTTISACVAELLAASPPDLAPFVGAATAANFGAVRSVTTPGQLGEFDRRYQLTLSSVPPGGIE